MSSLTFEERLREAVVDLREQLKQDERIMDDKAPKERVAQMQYYLLNWSTMYIRYLQIFRVLEECHDQILQPQKRADVRRLLDACIGRLLELKQLIVKHCGEYVNYDDVLVDLKLTPEVLEIPIPKYFLEERKKELEERGKLLAALIQQYGTTVQQAPAEPTAPLEDVITFKTQEEALLVLQCNERGRQGRQRARFMKEIREQEDRERKILEFGAAEADPHEAATKIQKVFKGCLARRLTARMRQEELEFLGMEETRVKEKAAQKAKLEQILARRKLAQQQNQQELDQERQAMWQKIKETEGGRVMEELHDQVTEKIIGLRQLRREVPEFPKPEEKGSLAFLQEEPELTEEQKQLEKE
eukprot:RCo040988